MTETMNDNEVRAAEWNKCISSRLEAMRSWYAHDEYRKGLFPYLMTMLSQRREHLEKKGNNAGDDQFIKGQIAMLKELMDIPATIDRQIALTEEAKKSHPSGEAGY